MTQAEKARINLSYLGSTSFKLRFNKSQQCSFFLHHIDHGRHHLRGQNTNLVCPILRSSVTVTQWDSAQIHAPLCLSVRIKTLEQMTEHKLTRSMDIKDRSRVTKSTFWGSFVRYLKFVRSTMLTRSSCRIFSAT